MQKSIFTKAVSLMLTLLLCLSCIISTGVLSASAAVDLYLRGTYNGWSADAGSKMTTTDGTVYTITVEMKAGEQKFKVADSNWGNQINSNGDSDQNFVTSFEYNSEVTFTANTSTRSLSWNAVPVGTPAKAQNGITLRCAWDQHNNDVLVQEGDKLTTRNYYTEDMSKYNCLWNIIPAETGVGAYLQNATTKQYLADNGNGGFEYSNTPTIWGTRFIGNNIVFASGDKVINIEDYAKGVALSYQPAKNTSAQWIIPLNYHLESDKVVDTAFDAVATSGTSITSDATGASKTWTLSTDISQYPQVSAPNSPLAEAVYNLSLEELIDNTYVDPEVGTVVRTGTAWNKVWTRDTAYSSLLSLAWINPEIATNCAYKKVHKDTDTGVKVFEQDTGTGGSYPNSTDRIVTLISVWETYLTNGNTEDLAYFYDVAYNTLMQDLHVVMDKKTGLIKGETGGIDWRDQTYPDWMSSKWDSGMVDIAEGKSAVVNAITVRAYEIMARMADVLGKGQDAVDFWTKAATELEEAMSTQLWSDDLDIYASWMYPEYMGNPLSGKGDILGNGFALWFDVGTEDQMQSIMQNYPLVNYGAQTTYPNKLGNGEHAQRYYHNRGIWPGWQVMMMVGANLQGNEALAEEIFDSNIHTAAGYLSNYEVVNYETGEGIHSTQQLWSIAGTLAGYYRLTFGMNYEENGITFNPTVQDWMEGPITLSNYKYRDATLNITVNGTGDKVSKFVVNGKEEDIATYVIPTTATGNYTIEITLDGNDGDTDTFTQGDQYLEICPSLPTMSFNRNTNTLSWTPVSGLTYKLWTGKEYIDVTGKTSYTIDPTVYGSYSLLSVAPSGIESEYSEPIIVSPTRIKLEAEEGSASSTGVIKKSRYGYSGTGYVVDNLGNSAELQLLVDVPTSGTYLLHGIYNNIGAGQDGLSCGIRSVYVDGEDVGSMVFPEVYSNYTWQESSHLSIDLSAGKHIIKVVYDTTNPYDQNMAWYVKYDVESDKKDYVSGIEFKNNLEFDYFVLDLVEAKDVDKEPLDPGTTLPPTPDGEPAPDYTYTVAGYAGLCGVDWTPSATQNDMTYIGNGMFQKVYKNVNAGEYKFKVAKNHGWEVSYGVNGGADDYAFTVAQDGSTVTITFNDNTKVPEVKVEFIEPTEPSEPKPSEPTDPKPTEPSDATEPTTKPAAKKTTVTLKSTKATVYVTGTTTIKATVKNGKGKTTYKTSNKKVATVNASGKVTAKKAGTAKITVTNNGVKKTFTVTVKNPKLNKTKATLKKNKTLTLKVTGLVGKAKFKTSNKKIATVNAKGKIVAKKKGTATITVTANGMKLKCKVTVK